MNVTDKNFGGIEKQKRLLKENNVYGLTEVGLRHRDHCVDSPISMVCSKRRQTTNNVFTTNVLFTTYERCSSKS